MVILSTVVVLLLTGKEYYYSCMYVFFSLCRRSIGISAVHMRACSVVLLCLNNLLLIFYIQAS